MLILTTPLFSGVTLNVIPGPPSAQSFTLNNLCFYTTIPNNKNDADYSNDASCINATFYTTSIKKNALLTSEVLVYPNPFSNSVKVSTDHPLQLIEIFNITGELIKQYIVSTSQADLKLDNFPAGIYFMKIYSEKGRVIKKAVKE